MGKIPSGKNKFLGTKNKLRLQKWCTFTENSDSVVGAKIRILKIHDELASLAHCQQAPVFEGQKLVVMKRALCKSSRYLGAFQVCNMFLG